MAQMGSSTPNPALQSLEFLAGEWEMELSNAAFLPDPSVTVKGRVSFEWLEHGAFICMRMGGDATWLISRDDSRSDYQAFYYDARSVSRVYEMSFSDGIWKIWREAPGFSQRYEGAVSHDSTNITAHWEKSFDGSTWEHDFDVTYTKLS